MTAPPRARRGFVLPLALFMVTVTTLLTALLVQGAVQELRVARGEVAGARVDAAAESALADFFVSPPDSAMLMRPRGITTSSQYEAGADSTRVTVQSLGAGLVRVLVSARIWSGGVRADATRAGFARIGPDLTGPPGTLRYRRLPGWWWAQIP